MRFFAEFCAVVLIADTIACATPAPPAAAARTAPDSGAPRVLSYEVDYTEGTEAVLAIAGRFPKGVSQQLVIEPGMERFVVDLAIETEVGGTSSPIARAADSWDAPACALEGCRFRYRFLLGEAGRATGDMMFASRYDGAVIAPPSTWLVRPSLPGPEDRYRFDVKTPAGASFSTGVSRAKDGAPETYEARAVFLSRSPYAAFGKLRTTALPMPEGEVELAILPGDFEHTDAVPIRWVSDAARTVSAYFGRFPVERALVLLIPTRGRSSGFAMALGNGGASIVAPVGRASNPQELLRDWQMTHEMVHLGFPNLPRSHHWLEEGVATYVEPIARARAGVVKEEYVWRGLIEGLPNGLPESGDRGLDRTHTWGRTYWGGALFCFLADLEIRDRTHNRRALDDALRGILRAGGDITDDWPIERTLAEADRATGVPVLMDLYRRMAETPVEVDLETHFRKLGVRLRGKRVEFDDAAPWAEIRRAITQKQKPPGP